MPVNHTYTVRYKLTYPLDNAQTNVPGDIQDPLDIIDRLLAPTYLGSIADRPASGSYTPPTTLTGTAGRRYYATDTGKITFDTGSAWIAEGPVNTVTGRITQSVPGASKAAVSGTPNGWGFAADATHVHAREAWGLVGDYKPAGTPSAGSSGNVAQSDHVHPGLTYGLPVPWLTTVVPSGYIQLAGTIHAQSALPILYSLWGTRYNRGGEGAGNFRVPNLVNRVLGGAGTLFSVGHLYGANTVTLTSLQMPYHRHSTTFTHTHSITDKTHNHLSQSGYDYIYGSSPSSTIYTNNGPNQTHSPSWNLGAMNQTATARTGITSTNRWNLSINPQYTNYTGTSQPHTNVQPTIGVLWITLAG